MLDSIFTRIYKGEIPTEFVYKDDEIFAIRDINPQAPVHVLIIPVEQIPTIDHLKDEDTILIGRMIQVAKDIARQEPELRDGYRLVFNCGEKSGQEVFHIHLHLLGGRQMQWPPG